MTGARYVYAIGCKGRYGDVGPCKIGIARSPEDRLRSLQTAHFRRLRLLASIWSERPSKTEVQVHKFLVGQGAKRRGEWFYIHPFEAVSAIVVIGASHWDSCAPFKQTLVEMVERGAMRYHSFLHDDMRGSDSSILSALNLQ